MKQNSKTLEKPSEKTLMEMDSNPKTDEKKHSQSQSKTTAQKGPLRNIPHPMNPPPVTESTFFYQIQKQFLSGQKDGDLPMNETPAKNKLTDNPEDIIDPSEDTDLHAPIKTMHKRDCKFLPNLLILN